MAGEEDEEVDTAGSLGGKAFGKEKQLSELIDPLSPRVAKQGPLTFWCLTPSIKTDLD